MFRTAEDLFFAVEDRCPLKGGPFSRELCMARPLLPAAQLGHFARDGRVAKSTVRMIPEKATSFALDALANLAA